MAELAAGALVAEQVVSTTIEGGAVAGYAIAKPTQPLKAILRQFIREDEYVWPTDPPSFLSQSSN